jgi:hypothetical protein
MLTRIGQVLVEFPRADEEYIEFVDILVEECGLRLFFKELNKEYTSQRVGTPRG